MSNACIPQKGIWAFVLRGRGASAEWRRNNTSQQLLLQRGFVVSTARSSAANARQPLLINLTGPVSLHKAGLIIPGQLSLGVWEKIGRESTSISESSTWWLADWVLYGETAYTGRYREVIEKTGLGYQTLRNYAWVARRFRIPRRRPGLSFAHHAEVAPLEPAEQDYWLRWAEQQKWSRNQLRKQIRTSLAERRAAASCSGEDRPREVARKAGTPGSDRVVEGVAFPAASIEVQLSREQLARCEKLARAHGLSLNEWVAEVLRAAITEESRTVRGVVVTASCDG